jgi:hypothetical protein
LEFHWQGGDCQRPENELRVAFHDHHDVAVFVDGTFQLVNQGAYTTSPELSLCVSG